MLAVGGLPITCLIHRMIIRVVRLVAMRAVSHASASSDCHNQNFASVSVLRDAVPYAPVLYVCHLLIPAFRIAFVLESASSQKYRP